MLNHSNNEVNLTRILVEDRNEGIVGNSIEYDQGFNSKTLFYLIGHTLQADLKIDWINFVDGNDDTNA